MRKMELMRAAFRWLLGLLLLWAAISKLANPVEFLANVYAYSLPLPRGVLQVVAVTLPWFELLCGLLLLAGHWLETALTGVTGLMALFLAVTGQAWARGLDISCGCFDFGIFGAKGAGGAILALLETPAAAFVRAGILLTLSLYLLRGQWKFTSGAPSGVTKA